MPWVITVGPAIFRGDAKATQTHDLGLLDIMLLQLYVTSDMYSGKSMISSKTRT